MKVIQVVECGGPGGTGRQVAALCNGLDPKRFEVALAYGVRGGAHQDYRALAPGAARAYHIPEFTREISPLKDAAAFWRLYRLFASEKPDVVHAHSSKAGFLARLAAKAAGVPKIFYSPRGYGFLQQDRSRAARLGYRALEWLASRVGTVVAVSPSEARLAPSRRVVTIPDAYLGELPKPKAKSESRDVVVGSCGRLTFARRPESFVLLSQRLTDSRNGVRCTWIGDGELREAMRRDLENMNLLSKVRVTGWLKPEEAQSELGRLDVFVHFSRWEGLPNAVLEAMAMGLPVVASDIPGNRDAVVHGETGYLAKDEVELLEYCLALADDPALRRRMGRAGRERVEKEFDFKSALAQLEKLYST